MSRAGDLYDRLYAGLCGRPPHPRPWHFQWLATRDLHRDLRDVLPSLGGKVLDLGCGAAPYKTWLGPVEHYLGADVTPGPAVDEVLAPGQAFPFGDDAFDTLLCTQVLEHVDNLVGILTEIRRALRPGGTFVLSVPFLYNIHGAPHDYRRFTEFGLQKLLDHDFELLELRRQGGIGSSLAVLWLNWLDTALNRRRCTRFAKAALLPVWIALSAATNLCGLLLDRADGTSAFYGNLLAVARKR